MADYFINAITRRVVFSGSAGVGPYAFTFEVLDENDVAVYKDSTKLTLTTDYTVTVNLNGTGSVTLVSAATSANTITILGARDIERVTDFVTAGDLRAAAINEQLDALTIFDQQLAEEQKRTLMAPPYDPAHVDDGGTLNMTLPAAAARANSFLLFDSAGNPGVQAAGALGAPTAVTRQQFSGDGSTVAFTLAADPGASGNSLSVYISGVYQQRATYTVVGTTLTFSAAPPLGTNNIEVVNYAVGAIGATDASLVTYTQGSAGSASRTVQNRLQETVSIKDFGAVGNGNADDTTAFDNALTAARAAGKPLYLPKGIYKRTTALLLQDGDSFIGDGWQESTIEFEPPTTLGACIVPEDDTVFTDFCRFEYLRIIGKASNTALTPIGLWGKSFRTSRFVHCEFNYFSQNCVYLYGQRTALGALDPGDSTYNYFEQCRFLSGVDPVRLGGTAGSPNRIDSGTSNINTFIRCRFASATRYGTWLEQGSANTFVACSWVANADSGIRVGWYGNTWTGCVAENNGAYGIRFDNEAETHDNWVFGMHDGGSNVSGLFQDQNNESYWFASNRGLKFGTESGGAVDNLSAYAKTDGHLYWQDNNGNAARISNNGGALVNLNANKNTTSGTPYLIPFNSETYDDDGFHSTAANVTRLTIPADGVSRVRLTANVEWASNATGYRQIAILKNGASVLGGGSLRQDALSSNGNIMNLCSGPIAVSPGDYFEIEATQTSGGSLIISNTNNTFFSIEVLR